MRKVVLAPSFDADFFHISVHIEDRFGVSAADAFEARFREIATSLAASPMIGTRDHGYPTTLYGFVLYPNWIFYRFTEDEITFLHVYDGRRRKEARAFAV